MNSQSLLNQPIPSDDLDSMNSFSAVEAFLKGASPAAVSGAPAAPEAAPPSAETNILEEELKKAQAAYDALEDTPAQRYLKNLEAAKVTLAHAHEIIDCLVVQNKPWREDVKLAKTLSATFQTRTPVDEERLRRALEDNTPKLVSTREFESAKYNIAASVVRYGDIVFHEGRDTKERDAEFQKKLAWVRSLSNPVFGLLAQKLFEFDAKIDLVLQPGYLENF